MTTLKVNGTTLIERLLDQLDSVRNGRLERIVIVTGYEGQKLRNYVTTLKVETPVKYVDNPIYATTNNIYSLWLAKDYLFQRACLQVKRDCARLMAELSKVPFLRVLPGQANYFACEVIPPFTAFELTKLLLTRFNILIKEFSSDNLLNGREFIRIAVRDTEDNNALIAAFAQIAWG